MKTPLMDMLTEGINVLERYGIEASHIQLSKAQFDILKDEMNAFSGNLVKIEPPEPPEYPDEIGRFKNVPIFIAPDSPKDTFYVRGKEKTA